MNAIVATDHKKLKSGMRLGRRLGEKTGASCVTSGGLVSKSGSFFSFLPF